MSKLKITSLRILVVLALGSVAWAQDEPPAIGFLEDDVVLQKAPDTAMSQTWIAPGGYERLAAYDSIIIEQPEVFLHPDSKYQGLKPDALKALADEFMNAIADEVAKRYQVVLTPREGTLHLRWAIGNVMLKKRWAKSPLAYTPVGAAADAVKKGVVDDITKKCSLVEMTVEVEILDSVTGERLAAGREWRRRGVDATTWEDLDALMRSWGKAIACRMDNARAPESERKACV